MTHALGRAHLPSTALGLVMAAAAGIHTAGLAFVIALLASLAVLVGIGFRAAGTLAVLLAAAAVMLTDAQPLVAGLAGLSASCYLLLRHTETGLAGLAAASSPAMIAALGFTFVGVMAAAFPLQLPWLPLLAPLAVFAVYVLACWPFFFTSDDAQMGRPTGVLNREGPHAGRARS
jgi:hypothetical protein